MGSAWQGGNSPVVRLQGAQLRVKGVLRAEVHAKGVACGRRGRQRACLASLRTPEWHPEVAHMPGQLPRAPAAARLQAPPCNRWQPARGATRLRPRLTGVHDVGGVVKGEHGVGPVQVGRHHKLHHVAAAQVNLSAAGAEGAQQVGWGSRRHEAWDNQQRDSLGIPPSLFFKTAL